MKLIGLTGPAGSGKDTVADILCEQHGYTRLALSDPLRDGLKAMLGLTENQFHDRTIKETPIGWIGQSPRQLLQTLGTEWGRHHVADDLWLRVANQRIADIANHWEYITGIVITDIRFPNEAAWLAERGGQLWHIDRPSAGLNGRAGQHASEAGLDRKPEDRIIRNLFTLDALESIVAEALEA